MNTNFNYAITNGSVVIDLDGTGVIVSKVFNENDQEVAKVGAGYPITLSGKYTTWYCEFGTSVEAGLRTNLILSNSPFIIPHTITTYNDESFSANLVIPDQYKGKPIMIYKTNSVSAIGDNILAKRSLMSKFNVVMHNSIDQDNIVFKGVLL